MYVLLFVICLLRKLPEKLPILPVVVERLARDSCTKSRNVPPGIAQVVQLQRIVLSGLFALVLQQHLLHGFSLLSFSFGLFLFLRFASRRACLF